MKKYKLIKSYPGSPPLGQEIDLNKFTCNQVTGFFCENPNGPIDQWIVNIRDIKNQPKFWEEVIEIPEYIKCINYRDLEYEEYIIGKIYKVENNGVRTEDGYLGNKKLPSDLKNHYNNADFIPSTKEEYDRQERQVIMKECIKRFPKGSKVKSAYDGKEFIIADSFIPPQENNWFEGVYYYGSGNGILAVEKGITRGSYLYYNGKYAELVEEPKDYEILSFNYMDNPNYLFILDKNGDYKRCGGTPHTLKYLLEIAKIHSIRRKSDSEIFTVGDTIQNNLCRSHNNKINHITLLGDHINLHYTSKIDGSSYTVNLNNVTKIKTPLFRTEDGVDKYLGDYYYSVWKDGSSDSIGGYTVDEESGLNGEDTVYFHDIEKAEEYIMMNKSCLSIQTLINRRIHQIETIPLGYNQFKVIIDPVKMIEDLKQYVKSKL